MDDWKLVRFASLTVFGCISCIYKAYFCFSSYLLRISGWIFRFQKSPRKVKLDVCFRSYGRLKIGQICIVNCIWVYFLYFQSVFLFLLTSHEDQAGSLDSKSPLGKSNYRCVSEVMDEWKLDKFTSWFGCVSCISKAYFSI